MKKVEHLNVFKKRLYDKCKIFRSLGVSKNKTVEGKQKLYENEYDPY